MAGREVILKVRSNSIRLRAALAIAAAAVIFAGGLVVGTRLPNSKSTDPPDAQLIERVNQLDQEITRLRHRELSPSDIVASSRNSICFILSTYRLSDPDRQQLPPRRYRVMATGFLTQGHIVVSNRHVMEPWFGDPQAERLIHGGAVPHREKVTAYFPSHEQAFELSDIAVSWTADVAVAHIALPSNVQIEPLRLAAQSSSPGDAVLVMGYPLGITTMLAKSTPVPYQLSAIRAEDREVDHLAQFRLIRPSATQGHLADASGTTLMYDASTARGSSGGPVFNMRGEVIGVNAALISGFNGTALGVSTAALQPLLERE